MTEAPKLDFRGWRLSKEKEMALDEAHRSANELTLLRAVRPASRLVR